MEPRKIGLYLKDAELARQLVHYWKRKAPQYRFCIYEEEEALRKAWSEDGWYRFLTDEAGKRFFTAEQDGGCVRILSDREGGGDSVFRYQSADQILAQILGMRAEADKNMTIRGREEQGKDSARPLLLEPGQKKPFVTGIYSPVNRCGKSRFALALGKVWGERERVLYLSLEVFSDLYEWLAASGSGDFADLLYYQEQGCLTASIWERLVRPWQGLAVIGPAVNPEDVLGLEAGRCEALLIGAAEAGYARIILDVGNCHPDPAGILALCGQIYAPVTEEEISRRKWKHFISYLEKTGRQKLRERITTVRLPESRSGYEADGFPNCGEELELFARDLLC